MKDIQGKGWRSPGTRKVVTRDRDDGCLVTGKRDTQGRDDEAQGPG